MPVIRGHPARITLYYMIGGLIWVVISDRVLSLMPAHSYALNRLMFVAVNALLLYLVARRYTKTLRLSHAAGLEAVVRSRGYFESSVEGIITADSDGMIRQVNPRAEEMFGYSELDLIGNKIEMLLPNRLRERHEAHRDGFAAGPESRRMGSGLEIVGRRKDGSEFPAEVSLNAISTRRGNQVVAFISDITERRAMEREARRNETLNALGAVAAGIAHELNNPLAVMESRIELMLTPEKGLAAETRDDLMVLLRNVVRASRISQNMLSLARQRPGAKHPIDMNAVIEDAIQIAGAEERGSSPRIETHFDRSLLPVLGDATSLQQVIINLAMNARDAGARTVRIETAVAPERATHMRVAVSDDGAGIASDAAAKLFEPFFTTKPRGTGLGLWLSQRIIREHGGTIAAHAAPVNGTTFVITLPTIGDPQTAAALSAARSDLSMPRSATDQAAPLSAKKRDSQ